MRRRQEAGGGEAGGRLRGCCLPQAAPLESSPCAPGPPADPSAIFVRKQALVLNLEGLKLIIGREKLLVLSVPSLSDLSTRTLPDLASPVVVRLASHIAMRAPWPFTDPGGGRGLKRGSATLLPAQHL